MHTDAIGCTQLPMAATHHMKNTTAITGAENTIAAQTVTIPGAFYDMMFERGVEVPLEEEIRRIGKGKQYEVRRDALFDGLVREADKYLSEDHHGTKVQAAAVSFLRSIRKQGVLFSLTHELPAQNTRRIIWIKTDAVAPMSCGKHAGRRIVLGIDRYNGNLIMRLHGTRQQQVACVATTYAERCRAEANRIIREKKAAQKAARLSRKAA